MVCLIIVSLYTLSMINNASKQTIQYIEVSSLEGNKTPYVVEETTTPLTTLEIDTMNVEKILMQEEGYRNEPYLCSEGYVTIGFGTKLHKSKGMNTEDFPIKINLVIAEEWLKEDVSKITTVLGKSSKANIFAKLNNDRRAIIISMAYQMGVSGVLKFNNMWKALEKEDYIAARSEALDSLWARQTPQRAMRHADVLAGHSLYNTYK